MLLKHNILVNKPSDVFHAITLVLLRHELMCVPDEIDVQRWNEERGWRGREEVQKAEDIRGNIYWA